MLPPHTHAQIAHTALQEGKMNVGDDESIKIQIYYLLKQWRKLFYNNGKKCKKLNISMDKNLKTSK